MKLVTVEGREIKVGDKIVSFRDEVMTVTGWSEGFHSGSTGRVHVKDGNVHLSYYPSVFNLRWKNDSHLESEGTS